MDFYRCREALTTRRDWSRYSSLACIDRMSAHDFLEAGTVRKETGREKGRLASHRYSSLRATRTTARETSTSYSRWTACSGPLGCPGLRRGCRGIEFQLLRLPALAHFPSRTCAPINIADRSYSTTRNISYALLSSL